MKQEQERTELQKRIAAELADKAKNKRPEPNTKNNIDGVDDSAYMEDKKRTTSLAWVWLLIAFATAGIIVWLVMIAG